MAIGYKEPGSIAAEIKMMRMVHAGAFLVLEGATDVRFWRVRRHENCELVDGEGKANVIGSVQRLNDEEFGGVLGIVDDDYDSLLGIVLDTDNVVRTDAHDLECVLCRSSALESVLAEFGDHAKIRSFMEGEGVDVRAGLLNRALIFGRVRLAALLHGLSIDWSAIRVQRFVDIDTWGVDGEGLARAVATEGVQGDADAVMRCIAELPSADPWRVVRGHEVVQILRMGLMRVLGSIRASVGVGQIEQALRLAAVGSDVQETRLVGEMRDWESVNEPYRVLRE